MKHTQRRRNLTVEADFELETELWMLAFEIACLRRQIERMVKEE